MNSVHDMGGMQNFGAIPRDDQLKFHDEWEKQVFALTLAMGATGTWNLDQSRAARESLPPSQYLSLSYYEIWLHALEKLLVQHQLLDPRELREGKSLKAGAQLGRCLQANNVESLLAAGAPVNRPVNTKPVFNIGDQVRVANQHKPSHTRLPNYIRGRVGVVARIHGAHVYPDSNALTKEEEPQWLYNVCFESTELWGSERANNGQVHVDCWESYLT